MLKFILELNYAVLKRKSKAERNLGLKESIFLVLLFQNYTTFAIINTYQHFDEPFFYIYNCSLLICNHNWWWICICSNTSSCFTQYQKYKYRIRRCLVPKTTVTLSNSEVTKVILIFQIYIKKIGIKNLSQSNFLICNEYIKTNSYFNLVDWNHITFIWFYEIKFERQKLAVKI